MSSTSLPCSINQVDVYIFYISLEPFSSTLPKVSSKSKYDVIEYKTNSTLAVTCAAQGFPVPIFRLVNSMHVITFRYRLALIYLLKEPLGTRRPTLVSDVKGIRITIEKPLSTVISLLCQAQGFPAPSFR